MNVVTVIVPLNICVPYYLSRTGFYYLYLLYLSVSFYFLYIDKTFNCRHLFISITNVLPALYEKQPLKILILNQQIFNAYCVHSTMLENGVPRETDRAPAGVRSGLSPYRRLIPSQGKCLGGGAGSPVGGAREATTH